MIEQRHFDAAERILADAGCRLSPAFHEGQRYALARCLAGNPKTTAEHNRETACPYKRGTAEHDAWGAGYTSGRATAVQARLMPAPGVLYALPLPHGGYVHLTEPELDTYAWEIVDEEGETTLHQGDGYPFAALALRDALNTIE